MEGTSDAWLLQRYKREGDRAAREELVRRMLPLARHVAGGYGQPHQREDLAQAAALGLAKAIDRWDPSRGGSLESYAVPTMRGEVRRWLRDHGWSVHMPRPLQERVMAVTAATNRLTGRDGRAPTARAIAVDLGISVEAVLEALLAGRAYGAASLEAPASDTDPDRTLAETLGGDDDRLVWVERVADLRALRGMLDPRERAVLHLRFVEDLTQSEIALRLGCSQMHVSRLLRRALQRLSDQALAA